ncbi:hypothetical protein C8R47DRAFT_1073986 [Mycena vitilis]|nr:hypothetical protein C8R47DRAFT_1073986 [Mycena vitilis]
MSKLQLLVDERDPPYDLAAGISKPQGGSEPDGRAACPYIPRFCISGCSSRPPLPAPSPIVEAALRGSLAGRCAGRTMQDVPIPASRAACSPRPPLATPRLIVARALAGRSDERAVASQAAALRARAASIDARPSVDDTTSALAARASSSPLLVQDLTATNEALTAKETAIAIEKPVVRAPDTAKMEDRAFAGLDAFVRSVQLYSRLGQQGGASGLFKLDFKLKAENSRWRGAARPRCSPSTPSPTLEHCSFPRARKSHRAAGWAEHAAGPTFLRQSRGLFTGKSSTASRRRCGSSTRRRRRSENKYSKGSGAWWTAFPDSAVVTPRAAPKAEAFVSLRLSRNAVSKIAATGTQVGPLAKASMHDLPSGDGKFGGRVPRRRWKNNGGSDFSCSSYETPHQ